MKRNKVYFLKSGECEYKDILYEFFESDYLPKHYKLAEIVMMEFGELIHGNARDRACHYTKTKQRNNLQDQLKLWKAKYRLKEVTDKKCIIAVIRHVGSGRKFQDRPNHAWGCKGLVDCFIREGLIVDDSKDWLIERYGETKDENGKEWTEVFYKVLD